MRLPEIPETIVVVQVQCTRIASDSVEKYVLGDASGYSER